MIDYIAIAAAILGLWLFVELVAFIRRLHREPEPPLLESPGDMYGGSASSSPDCEPRPDYRAMCEAAIQEAQCRVSDHREPSDACAVTVLAAMLEAGGRDAFVDLWGDYDARMLSIILLTAPSAEEGGRE